LQNHNKNRNHYEATFPKTLFIFTVSSSFQFATGRGFISGKSNYAVFTKPIQWSDKRGRVGNAEVEHITE
jgi:hypothetical protein